MATMANRPPASPVTIRLIAVDPPGDCYGDSHPILFGIQRLHDAEQVVRANATTVFDLGADLISAPDGHDVRGHYVHGRKGDRFLYLTWGSPEGELPFVMFARAKLKFSDVPSELVGRALADRSLALTCLMQATNEKGHPASGSIRPPRLSWSVEPV